MGSVTDQDGVIEALSPSGSLPIGHHTSVVHHSSEPAGLLNPAPEGQAALEPGHGEPQKSCMPMRANFLRYATILRVSPLPSGTKTK